MADTKKLNLEISVDKKGLTLLKEATKTTIAEIKALSQQAVAQAKADAQTKVQAEKTAQAQIKADSLKTSIELKANKQKEVLDYKDALRQKVQAERDAQNQIKAQSKVNPNLKGQSVTLGSEQAIKEQLKYWQQYKTTLAGTDPQLQSTTKHINQLKTSLNQIKGGGASRSDWEHWENLTTVFAGIGTALYGAYMAGQQFISFITDAVKKAAELEVYSKTFIEIAGSTEKANQQLQQLYNASAGNLTDTELVKYSNKMRLLGFTVEDTTKLLDIVERKADEVGVTFAEGESALQSFILAGRGRALKELGINLNEVTAEMDSLILASGKSKDAMESEELENIRLQAILNKYGDTLDNINTKQKDSGDRIKSISTGFENLSTVIGNSMLPAFNKLYNQISDFNSIVKDATGNTGILEKTLKDIVSINFSMITGVFSFWNSLIIDLGVNTYGWLVHLLNAGSELDRIINGAPQQGLPKEGMVDQPQPPQKEAKGGLIPKNTSKGSSKGSTQTITEITNEIIRLNKSLADLQKEQLSLGESAKGTSIFAIYLQQIQEIQDKLNYLNSPFKDSTGLDFITNLPKYDNSQNIKGQELSVAEQVNLTGIDKQAMQKEAYDKIVNGSQQALSNVQNIFQILDIGTDTFVSKLVNGFQTTLSIIDTIKQVIESINTVKQGIGILGSILSFTPIGGLTGGRNVGNLSTGGGQSPIVNKIYINSSIDTQKFFGDGVTTFYKNRKLNTVG